MNILKSLNLAFAFFLELAMVAALIYAGFHLGHSTPMHWLVGLGVPTVLIVFWGKYMAPNSATRFPDIPRRITTFVLFELSALALYKVSQPKLGLAMAVISAINVLLAYIWKQ